MTSSSSSPRCCSPFPAAAAGAQARLDDRDRRALDRMVGFLQDSQNDDGGYGGQPGAASDPLFSAWVGIGLAAAGVNPQDQRTPRGRDLVSYVARAGPVTRSSDGHWVTTEFERIGMLANAAGIDPRRFGGRDYVGPLLARQAPAGWFPHTRTDPAPGVNDTIFAIVFLAGVDDPALAPAIARAADAVEAMQRPDGTWPATRPGGPTDVDMTGAAIQALCAARRCGSPRVRAALGWLRERQQPDGGWNSTPHPGPSNTGTTPWVVQALWAAGIDPRTWRRGGRDPLDFLRAMQRRDGSVRWKAAADMNPTWMTAYAAPAYAGHAWPVPAPARARPERGERGGQDPQRRRRDERRAGRGGVAEEGDGPVAIGGGGRGAPLFSRPQPQSRGATPGGDPRDRGRAAVAAVHPRPPRRDRQRRRQRDRCPRGRAERARPAGGRGRSRCGRGSRDRPRRPRHRRSRPHDRSRSRPPLRLGRRHRDPVDDARHRRRGRARVRRRRPRRAPAHAEATMTALAAAFAVAGSFEDALARIAGALRVPVVLLALLALLALAYELGAFAFEWWRRRRPGAAAVGSLVAAARREPALAPALVRRAPSPAAGRAIGELATATRSERVLARFELAAQRRLDRTRLLVRAGPALGLMGTLIPLAPGLAALGRGDVAALADDLRTAFAATVIGLLVGTTAFALTLARTRMYSEDLAELEEATEA